jgi:uncharacterized integral membrane protein
MILRYLKLLFLLPLAAVIVLMAVSNRQPVTLSLDPLGRGLIDLKLTVPLFAALFAAMMVGVLIGGTASWLLQARHRRMERAYRREADKLKAEKERLQAAVAPAESVPLPLMRLR